MSENAPFLSTFVIVTFIERFHMTSLTALLVFQINETAGMLVYPENPLGVELFSHVNALFCSHKFA